MIDLSGLPLRKVWTRKECKASGHPGFIGIGQKRESSEPRFEAIRKHP
jgi:hypothetical protein